MATRDVQAAILSAGEEESPLCFSEWFKRRRQALSLTQEQLAKRAYCSVFAIRKIELGDRRPSRQLAGVLAQALEIPGEDQDTFMRAARGEGIMERLPSPAYSPCGDSQTAVKSSAAPGNLPQANAHEANLPRTLTLFIGREAELSALGQLLCNPQCLLLTIAGPGGIGKTRLAIEAANRYKDRFPDGVWFVPLVAVRSPALIIPSIADALGFRFRDPANPQAQLLRYLCEKRALLILDNAEHLLEDVRVYTEILDACPQVKLVVTSRERLNLLSEWVFEIQGLPVPSSERFEQFEAYGAVALFLQSARRVQAGFELREEERGYVLKICRILEGMPLGIELAAAWVGVLHCEAIAREIERNIDFLTVSMRDLPERHRSLRATLDHTWNLLNAEERLILSRLSVFHGGFRREAAQEICGASLAVLASFRNKMLLYRTDQDYYSLHELIRQYAEHKLRENPGEDERVKDRHASYYVGCLAEWEKALKSARQVETFNEIAQIIDNLSRGWQRMVALIQPQTLKSGQFRLDLFNRALFSLSLFYELHCRSLEAIDLFKESVACLKSIQTACEKTEDPSIFYTILGHITAYLGLHHIYILQNEQACVYLEEAIGLLAKGHSRVERAQAQVMLGTLSYMQGRLQKSVALLEESRAVFQEEGDRWWYLLSIINLSTPYISLGKLQECEALLQEGFGLIEPGDLRLGLPLRNDFACLLGVIKKDFDRAEQVLQEALELSYQLGNFRQTVSILLELGRLALTTQRNELAEEYFQKSIHLLKEFGETDVVAPQLYIGICFSARPNLPVSRDKFRQLIKLGQALDKFFMVYCGLVGIARTYMEEGQIEKALEIALAIRHYPIEHKGIREEGNRLLADLEARLPDGQLEVALQQMENKRSLDQVIAYALDCEAG